MNNFNSHKKYNNNKEVLNSIIRTKYIENNENICELLFNNKDLSNTNFAQFTHIISPSFVHILIKFNDIKEKDYFRKLMKKIVSEFTLNYLNNTFDNFNEKIYSNYESVLYFLELILDNFDNLKDFEYSINSKLFKMLNYLSNINENDNISEIVNQNDFINLIIDIFYLLLNTKGKFNPKNCSETIDQVEIFSNKINNNNFINQIFLLFFSELYEIPNNDIKRILKNINNNYLINLNIIPLNYDKYNYLSNIIKLFTSFDPDLAIINLIFEYLNKIFNMFLNIFLPQSENILEDKIEKIKEDFILCNFFHIYRTKKVYYKFYLYLIKYSKKINNNQGLFEIFQDLKVILMNIYNICPSPFYFELIIKFFQNEIDLQENIKYLKEILDMILSLEFIDPISNKLKQQICIFNTIQLLQIFYCTSKDEKICKELYKYGIYDYILKFFENLKEYHYICSNYCIDIYIKDKIYQQTILEICFNIVINLFLAVDDEKLEKKFFEFFLGNNIKIPNTKNKFGKSIVCILDLSNKELNKNIKEYDNQFGIYHSIYLEKYFKKKSFKKETKFLLIEFIYYLEMIKLKQIDNENLNVLDENSLIEKFLNLFLDDLILLINNSDDLKKVKIDGIYEYIKDSINKNKSKNNSFTKENILIIFLDICQNNNIKNENIFNETINLNDLNLYTKKNDECFLKSRCLLLNHNLEDEILLQSEISNEYINSYFDIEHKNVIKCFKKDLLLKDCSIYFDDIYFYNKNFLKIKNSFYYNYESNLAEETFYDIKNNLLNYPTKLKNFSSNKYALPKIFLSCNTKLYQNSFFSLLYPRIKKELIKNSYPILPSHFIYYNELLNNNFQNVISNYKINCELISVKNIVYGEIIFYPNYLIFRSHKDKTKIKQDYETNLKYIYSSGINEIQIIEKIIIIEYDEIDELFSRCFVYIPQALEIFLKNGKSYFFNFIEENNLKQFYDIIMNIQEFFKLKIIKNPKQQFFNLKITEKWEKEEITNEQYLLYLNKYSGRTFNNIYLYPVFPWVTLIKEYFPEKTKITKNTIFYRDMSNFMQVQTEKGKDDALFNYENSLIENEKNPIHFRIHYSTGSYILLYLMRVFPFMDQHIKLQSNSFDNPSRMLHNINEILNIIKESNENRELIPEFFTSIEYFLNLNYVYYGKRQADHILVNNMLVPEINLYHKKLSNFIYFNKIFLNNRKDLKLNGNIDLDKCPINEWINLIFGYKQYPKDKNLFNAFEKYSNRQSYYLPDSFKKLKTKNLKEDDLLRKINAKKLRVLYFGQTPEQIFKTKHSKCNGDWKSDTSFKNYKLDDIIDKDIKVITFWISDDKNYFFFFFLIKNLNDQNIYIYIYDEKMEKKYEVNIGKIKLYGLDNIMKKIKNKENEEKDANKLNKDYTIYHFVNIDKKVSKLIDYKDISDLYNLNPRDALITFYAQYNIYFIIGRYKDNTIKIFCHKNKSIKGIIKLNSFVSVLHKKDQETFFSGHMNGIIIEWEIEYKNLTDYDNKLELNNIIPKREIKAHNNCLITTINYNEKHNIILSADVNGILYIRKYYDFELLSKIKLKENNCFTTQILLNDFNFIYTINYNQNEIKKYICIYTLNGILIEKSDLHTIIDAYILNNGKTIFNRLEETELYIFGFNNENTIINDNIINKLGYFKYDYIMNFEIKDNNIYILLKDGIFIEGFYNSLNLVGYGIN